MSDFIFSVNVTFPIFLVMVIGWVLHQIGMLDEHFVTVANRFNFKVTKPFFRFPDCVQVTQPITITRKIGNVTLTLKIKSLITSALFHIYRNKIPDQNMSVLHCLL